eukprot:TRINITY_DN16213_c0_g1_i2.p1 TRINITY_DN16213_c0_g1~~TRINITY_DN16213_c0_g1_i2.p1  ORF type:complete len:643 (+),score=131.47 TRINITY_DN16213_c0_g1_i2:119-2047(+)
MFYVLLLNTATKDEGEEFLDYFFPLESHALQGILPMKGVFLASRGIMKAAVGQEVKFLVFRSLDGGREIKVCLLPLERWLLCVLLPASATDATSQFFAEEAAALISLRHGRLASVQSNFRQLDPVFRALANLWCASLQGPSPFGGAGAANRANAGLLYASLGVAQWHSLSNDWIEVVKLKVDDWEKGWKSMVPHPALAQPQGFALFLESALMATSLDDQSFTACLRLLALEGMLLDFVGGTPQATSQGVDGADVRCHSFFLHDVDTGDEPLPSHQYSLMLKSPWLLFVLWGMQCNGPETPSRSKARPSGAKAHSEDPFGVDLSLELLGALPLPPGYAGPAAVGKGSPLSSSPSSRSLGRSTSGEKKRSFGLACGSIFKPPARSKASPSESAMCREASMPKSHVYALDFQGGRAKAPAVVPVAFSRLQDPLHACKPDIREGAGLLCPVLGTQARKRRCAEWTTAAEGSSFVVSWSNLDQLCRSHAARLASWSAGPSKAAKRHVLLDILRGDNALDKIWDECLQGSTLCENLEQEADAEKKHKKTEATLLGSGEPWRFQDGAPYLLADLPPLISAGALVTAGQNKAWMAISATVPSGAAVAPPAGDVKMQGLQARSSGATGLHLPGNHSFFAMAADDQLASSLI